MRTIPLILALALLPAIATAHAFLDEATPKVGSEDNPSPPELRLKFTQGVEPDFSHVVLTRDGTEVPLAALSVDAADNSVLVARPQAPLPQGSYRVAWEVVSVDTHHTSGGYGFTVGAKP